MRLPVTYLPTEALQLIKSGDRVFIHGSAQTPTNMLRHLSMQTDRLKDVELVFISVLGEIFVDKPNMADSFIINSLFVSEPVGKGVQ